ncbi:MAG: hypothetical protein H0U95_17650 [Bacteroidetes bacterium]|nr:hypothetical protein [Bacteroidota bacterium]
MNKYLTFFLLLLFFLVKPGFSQTIYYKNVSDSILPSFKDTANRIILVNGDSSLNLKNKFAYVQRFFPKIEFQNIKIKFRNSQTIVKIKPTFASIFKAPKQRTYKIFYSNLSETTLDSVLLKNLSLNSQLGLIAVQMSRIEDFRTGGFFDFVAWHFKQLSTRSKNKINYDDELRAIEAGLGYQLLSLSKENEEKLKIEKWKNVKGYANYIKQNKKRSMSAEIISNFVNDQPVYHAQQYK